MTQRVIDRFEVIDIDHQQSDPVAGPRYPPPFDIDSFVETDSVFQTDQAVETAHFNFSLACDSYLACLGMRMNVPLFPKWQW